MNRKHLAVLILVIWMGAMGWLIRREYFPADHDLLFSNVVLSISPGATYYRLLVGDQQVGFASSTVDTLADTVRLQDVVLMEIPSGGVAQRVEGRTVANMTRGLALRSFEATFRDAAAQYVARGMVEGDTQLSLTVESVGGFRNTVVLPIDPRVTLPMLLPLQLAFRGELQAGRAYTHELLDPLLLTRRATTARVVAESTWVVPDSADLLDGATQWTPATYVTLHAWQVNHALGALPYSVWVDDLGQVVDATTPSGFHVERTAYEIAYENFANRARKPALVAPGTPIEHGTVWAVRRTPPGEVTTSLRVLVRGSGLDGFDLAGGTQHREGDTIVVTLGAPRAAYRLPFADTSMTRYLLPELFLESDDPRIQAQARQIVGRIRDPVRAARLLAEWVHERVAPEPAAGALGAVEVLEGRRGDANEYTVLFVALARAVGLPTRNVAGLVYVDGVFYYHAWPEVYFADWVPVDPTFGQFPADAARLRMTVNGLARHMEMIRLIGRIDLEVVEASTE